MASVKCGICGEGIHYHSMPNGIEYTFINNVTWDKICSSKFNSDQKEYGLNQVYPKLYRSDTIEDDFENEIIKAWKCPNCKSILIFDKLCNVTNTYYVCDDIDEGNIIQEGVVFEDYLWDKLTERAVSDEKLVNQKPTVYIRVFGNSFVVSRKSDFSEMLIRYKQK
jgi:hypothetical protein